MKRGHFLGILFLVLLAWACSMPEQNDVKVMTFNMRYDNPEDSAQNWNFRKDNVSNLILFQDADIIGMQEVLQNQLNDLKERLPQYAFEGVAREDGKEDGEYAPVFFRKDKFSKIDGGTFWLSETPDEPSFGWDAACRRISTWLILKELGTGREFAVFNAHFDHEGEVAKKESAALLLQKIRELAKGRPVLVTGDFNSTPDSEAIKTITKSNGEFSLYRSRGKAPLTFGHDWTYHEFGRLPLNKRPCIDYVFVDQGFDVNKYGVFYEIINGVYLTDHCPVLVQLSIN